MARRSHIAIKLYLVGLVCRISSCLNESSRRDVVHHRPDIGEVSTISCSVATIFGLATVDCSAQNISTVDQVHPDGKVQVLQLAENRLVGLGPDMFGNGTPNLQQLYLARNFISYVDKHAFRGLSNLQILDLSENRLPSVPVRSLSRLATLRILSMRGNAILQLDAYSFSGLPLVESLDLTQCQLVSADWRAFAGCVHLADLSLAGNRLTQLSPGMIKYLPQPSVLRRFRVDGNRWLCDCRLRWLRKRVAIPVLEGLRQEPVCAGPALLRGVPWRLLSPQHFICPSTIITDSHQTTTRVAATVGANVTISCVVTGDPEPRLRWIRYQPRSPGLPLPVSIISRSYDHDWTRPNDAGLLPWRLVSSLRIVNISSSDAGEYHCTADNPAGHAQMTYTLIVTDSSSANSSRSDDQKSQWPVYERGLKWSTQRTVLVAALVVIIVALVVSACAIAFYQRSISANRVNDIAMVTMSSKSVRRSMAVAIDSRGWYSTAVVSDADQARTTVAWANRTPTPNNDSYSRSSVPQRTLQ